MRLLVGVARARSGVSLDHPGNMRNVLRAVTGTFNLLLVNEGCNELLTREGIGEMALKVAEVEEWGGLSRREQR